MHAYQEVYTDFGFAPGVQPTLIGLIIILAHLLEPVNTVLHIAMTYNSRRYEILHFMN